MSKSLRYPSRRDKSHFHISKVSGPCNRRGRLQGPAPVMFSFSYGEIDMTKLVIVKTFQRTDLFR